jgi:glycosyltransferase involved in cell wall biosynthesis
MRIAQIAPLLLNVPPSGHGGIERMVSYITEELVRLGHEVTLFATADSQTQARLVPCSPAPLIDTDPQALIMMYILMLERVYGAEDQFDVIHSHLGHFAAPMARRHSTPTVATTHDPLRQGEEPIWREYQELALVAISNQQRQTPFPWLNWRGTVYASLPADLYSFQARAGDYLAFIGRITPEKGLPTAIAIAQQTGMPIKIAGKAYANQVEYFETQIQPLLADSLVEYVGELNDAEKDSFLGGAAALLFPIEWEEPFGMVMIEALACGTPVIATPRGAVPEIIKDGENGYLVRSVAEGVAAVERLSALDRRRCRETFEERFTIERMAQGYLAIYEQLLNEEREVGGS